MTIYDELVARGLIAQVTDEEEIKELINNGKVKINLNTEIKYNSKLDNKSSIFRI